MGVLAQLAHVDDAALPLLARSWVNSPYLSVARDRALGPDSPLVLEVLGAFDAVAALFADDLAGQAPYLTVDRAVTTTALKAVRDAIAGAYARPVLSSREHEALLRPWRTVYPEPTVGEPDLGPRGEQVKALLECLPGLAGRCHDPASRSVFEELVDRSYVAESERVEAAAWAFDAAVLTSRRRVWALVRRTGTQGLLRSCPTCHTPPVDDQREVQRVLSLCLDAACAFLVADALSDASTELLTDPVAALIPLQRAPGSS